MDVVDRSAATRTATDASDLTPLRALFAPRTVAIIGASRRRGAVGAEVLHNVVSGGFTGRVFPINPRADAVQSLPAYPRVTDVSDPIDLAVIAVPAACVDAVVDDCLAKQIPALVVVTAGFGETGDEGRAREAVLRDRVRQGGSRMVGPNCLGVLTTNPDVRLNATFSPVVPPCGPIAFSSQSGALGLAVLERAGQLNLGISDFVSVGNKADVSTNDLIAYWGEDPRTTVILLYVESFGNPKRFRQIARRVSRTKPIIAVKAGRSASGARAALSHTGAIAASDMIVDALFHDAGVIRTETLEELFDTAVLLADQPLPSGPRVAILTNAGGPGILAADVCDSLGLTLASFAPATVEGLRTFLPRHASLANPIDMIATATPDHYRQALPLLLLDPNVDSVLVMFTPVVSDPEAVARAINDGARGASKPVLATFFGAENVASVLSPVPCYTFPESSVRALAHAVAYRGWRDTPPSTVPVFDDIDTVAARQIVNGSEACGGGWLSPLECSALLMALGIHVVGTSVVSTLDAALEAAARVAYPVVLKGAGPAILHKSDAGTIFIDLRDEDALRNAFRQLQHRPEVTEIVLQTMIGQGVEMIVGGLRHDRFGHAVLCGSGGTLVELLHDTSCRLTPLTVRDAEDMLNEVRGVRLLRGFRGAPPKDEAALRSVVLRVSTLLELCPGIVELDLNPVVVTSDGAHVVDARIRVAPPA
jgi:acetate---CoA ligase (ADP-forming)